MDSWWFTYVKWWCSMATWNQQTNLYWFTGSIRNVRKSSDWWTISQFEHEAESWGNSAIRRKCMHVVQYIYIHIYMYIDMMYEGGILWKLQMVLALRSPLRIYGLRKVLTSMYTWLLALPLWLSRFCYAAIWIYMWWRGIARNSIGMLVHHGFVSGISTMWGPQTLCLLVYNPI